MYRRCFLMFLIVFGLAGCRNMETKKGSSDDILAEELKSIDMKEVDEYPTFAVCDTFMGQKAKRDCFKRGLTENFHKFLASKILVINEKIDDTIWLNLTIMASGDAELTQVKIPDSLRSQAPQMERWLRQSMDSLPKIYPAIKRGIPVKTTFKMPVVIEVE